MAEQLTVAIVFVHSNTQLSAGPVFESLRADSSFFVFLHFYVLSVFFCCILYREKARDITIHAEDE